MAKIKLMEIVTKMVNLLTPLKPEERQRAIDACLTVLGDDPSGAKQSGKGGRQEVSNDRAGVSQRAGVWMTQNSVSMEELEQVFHIADGTVEVIASEIPGKTDKEKTYGAYVLVGIAKFLASGNPNFDDKSARAVCKSSGCLNEANHASYLKHKGNEFTGSKQKGWALTAPGLRRGAALVKELNKQAK